MIGYLSLSGAVNYGLILEFGICGTLNEWLKRAPFNVAVKLPLLMDLCHGLQVMDFLTIKSDFKLDRSVHLLFKAIHNCMSIKFHGNLTSNHCSVTDHFVLKICLDDKTLLKKLQAGYARPPLTDFEQLWSAPEILRDELDVKGLSLDIVTYKKIPFVFKIFRLTCRWPIFTVWR